MTEPAVRFAPETLDQLSEILEYVASATGEPTVATNFVESIITFCEGLDTFPLRGRERNDIRPGLRVTTFKRRVLVAYTCEESRVLILGVFYGGRDFEEMLRPE